MRAVMVRGCVGVGGLVSSEDDCAGVGGFDLEQNDVVRKESVPTDGSIGLGIVDGCWSETG